MNSIVLASILVSSALCASVIVTSRPRTSVVGDVTCPPPGFQAVTNISVADYISAPWYAQLQTS